MINEKITELYSNLNEDQKLAFDLCLNNDRVLILGGAGTGKSVLINVLKTYFESEGLTVELCASTGKAATLIGGETINRLAKIPPSYDKLYNLKYQFDKMEIKKGQTKVKGTQYVSMPDKVKYADVIICDEVSMITPENFYYFNELILRKDKPTKIIFVGDFNQLPCVTTDEIKSLKTQDTTHLSFEEWQFLLPFDSYFCSQNWKIAKLKEIMRCQNQEFNIAACNIAKNKFSSKINSYFMQEVTPSDLVDMLMNKGYIYLTPLRDRVKQINDICIETIPGISKKYDGDIPFEAKLGMRVMSVINDDNDPMRYQNGSMGIIIGLEKEGILVKFDDFANPILIEKHIFSENHYNYLACVFENISYDSKIAEKLVKTHTDKFSYIPLLPAYAMTVHKAQGSGFDKLILDPGDYAFSSGLLYTMITRSKDPSQAVLLRPLRKKDIKVFPEILELNELIDTENRLFTPEEIEQKYLDMQEMKKKYYEQYKYYENDFRGVP